MARKISISFKSTKKDIELYNFLSGLDDKSADIKNVLRNAFSKDLKQTIKDNENEIDEKTLNSNSEIDVLNF